jgi:hypothetical protein
MTYLRLFLLFAFVATYSNRLLLGEDVASESAAADSDTATQAGHSYHGEAFNEGPRQAAKKMEGLAKITFPTSAKLAETQAFIEQGIAQLHGFWYLEAERSFRQAAANEPELAIAYWGCAMANVNNRERAIGFIEEAMKRREVETTQREKLYIEAFERYLKATQDKPDDKKGDEKKPADDKPVISNKKAEKAAQEAKDNAKKEAKRQAHERYIADLEGIIHEFPDDLEAKAFLVLQLWLADGEGVKMTSRYAVNCVNDRDILSRLHASDPSLSNSLMGWTATKELS